MSSQVQVTFDSFSSKGRGIGSVDSCVIETFGVIPGDTALVTLGKKRKGRKLGILQEILAPSPMRITAVCRHASICGGCTFQAMSYSEQLKHKQEQIEKLFAEFKGAQFFPIIPCESPWRYRNKMEFSFSQNKAGDRFLGLMMAGSSRVLNLEECHLCSEWFSDLLQMVRAWWKNSGLDAYHPYRDTGSLRTLTLREGFHTKEKMIILTVSGNPEFAVKRELLDSFVKIVKDALKTNDISIFLRIHQIQKGSPTQFFEHLLYGKDHFTEKLNVSKQLTLKVSPDAFFQPNTRQAEKIYRRARQLLADVPKKTLLDLYCGTGTIGMSMADLFEEVIGIELNPYAVYDAKTNLEQNTITNMTVYKGDVAKILQDLRLEGKCSEIDVVIIDPPRAGLDKKAIDQLKEINPKIILYVSCHPKTQAENVKELFSLGYEVKKIHPMDQFPHTPHVENIVFLERKGFFS